MAVKVKICGLTRKEDIYAVNKYLPEYIGFVFTKSKRKIMPEEALHISRVLDDRIRICGVFKDEDPDVILRVADLIDLSVIQLHGSEDVLYIEKLKNRTDVKIWKGCYAGDSDILNYLEAADKVVADSQNPGTGNVYNRELLKTFSGQMDRLIVAGGLTNGNLRCLLDIITPYCVDVSTGVEENGSKKEYLIGKFVNEVRSEI